MPPVEIIQPTPTIRQAWTLSACYSNLWKGVFRRSRKCFSAYWQNCLFTMKCNVKLTIQIYSTSTRNCFYFQRQYIVYLLVYSSWTNASGIFSIWLDGSAFPPQGSPGQRGPLGPVGPSGVRVRSTPSPASCSHCVPSQQIDPTHTSLKGHVLHVFAHWAPRGPKHVLTCAVAKIITNDRFKAETNIKLWHWCIAWIGSPVCCGPCVMVCYFYTGATRKGGTIWTQRPTRAHGECVCVCVSLCLCVFTEKSQTTIPWSMLSFLLYLHQLLLWLHSCTLLELHIKKKSRL